MIETVPSIAGERMPHGSPVRIERKSCLIERDDRRVDGVTRRPHQTLATHHERGEPLIVQTSGAIKAERDGRLMWLELHRGRIVDA